MIQFHSTRLCNQILNHRLSVHRSTDSKTTVLWERSSHVPEINKTDNRSYKVSVFSSCSKEPFLCLNMNSIPNSNHITPLILNSLVADWLPKCTCVWSKPWLVDCKQCGMPSGSSRDLLLVCLRSRIDFWSSFRYNICLHFAWVNL